MKLVQNLSHDILPKNPMSVSFLQGNPLVVISRPRIMVFPYYIVSVPLYGYPSYRKDEHRSPMGLDSDTEFDHPFNHFVVRTQEPTKSITVISIIGLF